MRQISGTNHLKKSRVAAIGRALLVPSWKGGFSPLSRGINSSKKSAYDLQSSYRWQMFSDGFQAS